MKFRPDNRQPELEFTRSEQLSILRECRLGDPRKRNDRKPFAKLLLRAIDDHIGRQRTWKFTVEELAQETEMSLSSAYQWLAWLNEAGLVGFDPLPDGRREYWICWPELKELTPDGTRSIPPHGMPVQNTDRHSTTRNDGPESGPPFQNTECSYKEERNLSALLAPPSPPPGAHSEQQNKEAVVMAVKDAGVTKCVEAVEIALANGLSLETIMAVVEHFNRHPGKWEGGGLYQRLTLRGARMMRPDEGWCPGKEGYRPPKPATTQTDDLEARYGPALDALTEDEVDDLTAGMSPRWIAELERFGRAHRDFRPDLLRLLHRQASSPLAEVGAAS